MPPPSDPIQATSAATVDFIAQGRAGLGRSRRNLPHSLSAFGGDGKGEVAPEVAP